MYEQQDQNASPVAGNPSETLSRSLDENNVMGRWRTNSRNDEREEETDEEVYEDEYEVEESAKIEQSENSKLSRISDGTAKSDKPEDASRDEDYVEDPSTSQYDAYYYYDDYESNNRSRYQAVGKNIITFAARMSVHELAIETRDKVRKAITPNDSVKSSARTAFNPILYSS